MGPKKDGNDKKDRRTVRGQKRRWKRGREMVCIGRRKSKLKRFRLQGQVFHLSGAHRTRWVGRRGRGGDRGDWAWVRKVGEGGSDEI